MGPSPINEVLHEKGSLDTDRHMGRMLCEDRGRDQTNTSTSQGVPRITSRD